MISRTTLALALLLLSVLPLHADEHGAITSQILAKSSASWDGARLPAYPAGQPEITILRIRIPAGAELPRHYHPVINAGVLLSGELTVVTGEGEVLRLQAGEAIIEVVNKWHYGRNEGDEAAEIIVFYAGSSDGGPVTVTQP